MRKSVLLENTNLEGLQRGDKKDILMEIQNRKTSRGKEEVRTEGASLSQLLAMQRRLKKK